MTIVFELERPKNLKVRDIFFELYDQKKLGLLNFISLEEKGYVYEYLSRECTLTLAEDAFELKYFLQDLQELKDKENSQNILMKNILMGLSKYFHGKIIIENQKGKKEINLKIKDNCSLISFLDMLKNS
jgi:hypothetical protein